MSTSTKLAWALLGLHRSSSLFSALTCFLPLLFTISILILNKHLAPQTPSQGLLLKNPICDKNCLFKPIAHFPVEVSAFFFFLAICWCFLFSMDTTPLLIACMANIFSHSGACFLHFFIVSLDRSPSFGCNSVSQFFFPF